MRPYLLLLRDLMKRLGWRFPVLVVWTALIGLGEGATVILLLPLLSRMGIAPSGSQGVVLSRMEDGLAAIRATTPPGILAVIIAIVVIQTGLSIALTWWTAWLARHYQSQRQLELFGAIMRARWAFIADKKAGEITNAIVTETERLGGAFTMCLSLIASGVVTIIYIVLSMVISWQVTLTLIAFAAVAGLTMSKLYVKTYTAGRSLAPLNAELQSLLTEHFAGAKYIKASVGVDHAAARIAALVGKLEKTYAFANSLPGTIRSILEAIGLIGLAFIFVLGNRWMGVAAGNVVVVLALFGRLFPRITTLQAHLHHLSWNVPGVEVIDDLQSAAEAEAERQDGTDAPLKVALPTTLAVRGLQVKLGARLVLDRIDLTLPVPGMLAVVGRSGSGKSTLVHALLGLVEPTMGSIRLGQYDLATTPLRNWRRTIGYVPQETILFHASIRDNLTLVNPTASEADIIAAARHAHALEFIEAWPDGFDTIIGDQGVKLSGGQRQRLGIARALMTDPVVLILDEAMSALDGEFEAEVIVTLEELRKRMGILLVAHRLAAVRSADTICVFDDGHIVEAGAWVDLMSRKTLLRDLADQQSFAPVRSVGAV